MKKLILLLAAGLLLLTAWARPGSAALKGDYIEARSADVYTGPCFANSEVGLTGQEAILRLENSAGRVERRPLAGLSVVAVVRANATLGDPYHDAHPARTVLIMDSRANRRQRAALTAFAASMTDGLLDNVVRVETAPIQMMVEHGDLHGAARVVAGRFAQIETRSLCQGDHLCGNESVYYPPLVALAHSMPAFTLDSSFSGQGFGRSLEECGQAQRLCGQLLGKSATFRKA